MKKELNYIIVSIMCITTLFSGCSEKTRQLGLGENMTPVSDEKQTEETKNVSQDSDYIDLVIKENHQVHAKVHTPNITQCRTYKMEFIDFDAEKTAKIFAPEDNSSYTTEYDARRGRTNLTTADGNQIITSEGRIMFFADYENRYKEINEIGNLIEYYAKTHDDSRGSSLDFMTCEEAIESGKQIMQDLGINLQAEVKICCGLNHEQLMTYQQELIAADAELEYPRYDPFDNVYMLSNLTEASDSYFLKFGFSCENIPVLGYPNEPNFEMKNGVFPPIGSSAEMIISRDGVQKFLIYGASRILESSEPISILSANDVIVKYAEKWGQSLQPVPEEKWEVRHLYLEYIPVYTEDGGVLTPYWCVVQMWKSPYIDEEAPWSSLGGTRYNAITGGDFAYGQ